MQSARCKNHGQKVLTIEFHIIINQIHICEVIPGWNSVVDSIVTILYRHIPEVDT